LWNDRLQSSRPLRTDPLATWNEGNAKRSIISFVARTSTVGSPDFVPRAQRIAVFDNDGTLWSEQPLGAHIAFVLDRVKELAAQHPEWKAKQPYKAMLEGDIGPFTESGIHRIAELVAATHAGLTTEEFLQIVRDWLVTNKHPRFKRRYYGLVYQPMLELLAYLRANGFKNFIVSPDGVEFVRAFCERVYGIPPEHVVGTCTKTRFEMRGTNPVLVRLQEMDVVDDGPGKPAAINQYVGRRPIAAFGNSDADVPMLQWADAGEGPRLIMIVHHTDEEREVAYDRQARIGRLDKGLEMAKRREWHVVDMKRDWNSVFSRPA
jgi:phosphoserine phosphatase